MLIDAIKYVLYQKKAKKITVEVFENIRKGIIGKFKRKNGIRVCKYTEILYWPVFNMRSWDPKLKGNRMKKLRNIRSRFYKNYRIRIKDSRKVPKEKLKNIFQNWIKKRIIKNQTIRNVSTYYFKLGGNIRHFVRGTMSMFCY